MTDFENDPLIIGDIYYIFKKDKTPFTSSRGQIVDADYYVATYNGFKMLKNGSTYIYVSEIYSYFKNKPNQIKVRGPPMFNLDDITLVPYKINFDKVDETEELLKDRAFWEAVDGGAKHRVTKNKSKKRVNKNKNKSKNTKKKNNKSKKI